ncbi:conserved protein [Tepidicaulis marinus]|uniref:Conserved protein n=1 Tax=Tepidicaulis marinus TaxID=1333998 RepID=A0A081BBC5_9HYPH|nr:hypothetical protein [Tepidicaulis marinus]GAK45343.1 conserved protein [Tepidicaulis marinus]
MIVFRLIGLIFIAIALMLLGADGIQTLESGEVSIRSLSEVWTLLHPSSMESFMAWSGETLPPVAQDPVLSTIMGAPSWASFGVIGIIIALLFRRRD